MISKFEDRTFDGDVRHSVLIVHPLAQGHHLQYFQSHIRTWLTRLKTVAHISMTLYRESIRIQNRGGLVPRQHLH